MEEDALNMNTAWTKVSVQKGRKQTRSPAQ